MSNIGLAGIQRGYEGIRHSSLSAPRLYPPSLNVKSWLDFPSKEVEAIAGDRVLMQTNPTEFFDIRYEAAEVLVVGGAHTLPVMRALDPDYASSVETPLIELLAEYMSMGVSLELLMQECRDTFHHRVSTLVTKRAPRQAIDMILSCAAHVLEWNEIKLNQAASAAMHDVPGNPYNVDCDTGVNRQTALIYLYFGPFYEQNRLNSRPIANPPQL